MSNLKPNPGRNSMKLDPGGRKKQEENKTPQDQTELSLEKQSPSISSSFSHQPQKIVGKDKLL
jgi:hypothetical protein